MAEAHSCYSNNCAYILHEQAQLLWSAIPDDSVQLRNGTLTRERFMTMDEKSQKELVRSEQRLSRQRRLTVNRILSQLGKLPESDDDRENQDNPNC